MFPASIRAALAADEPRITDVWEAAVRATHDFLAEDDIVFFRSFLPQIFGRLNVRVIECAGQVEGFIATNAHHVEALFVNPALHGQGLGRRLLDEVIAEAPSRPAWTTDVNEQNPRALRFYRRYGFVEIGRSELDGSGRPFPLLHLVLRA
ncbi:putative acetyltransferase [Dyella jiangningensis]|uniref:GNAT family N-acetyltransferase n=1 Tax=Dyella sp. AtDHG13 TaxID=1938897 RepID=UPI00088838BB|nr:GNAT family N-acetyltransferase [Dyella sp. AtDHG13]PXV59198.1 putative acetyltransferase [Dyella sp. AtDHG13]SDK25617.1 putative acetyltransferase [Dyella jiangningensis]